MDSLEKLSIYLAVLASPLIFFHLLIGFFSCFTEFFIISITALHSSSIHFVGPSSLEWFSFLLYFFIHSSVQIYFIILFAYPFSYYFFVYWVIFLEKTFSTFENGSALPITESIIDAPLAPIYNVSSPTLSAFLDFLLSLLQLLNTTHQLPISAVPALKC